MRTPETPVPPPAPVPPIEPRIEETLPYGRLGRRTSSPACRSSRHGPALKRTLDDSAATPSRCSTARPRRAGRSIGSTCTAASVRRPPQPGLRGPARGPVPRGPRRDARAAPARSRGRSRTAGLQLHRRAVRDRLPLGPHRHRRRSASASGCRTAGRSSRRRWSSSSTPSTTSPSRARTRPSSCPGASRCSAGAGMINLEGLISSERELVYSVREFEDYRRVVRRVDRLDSTSPCSPVSSRSRTAVRTCATASTCSNSSRPSSRPGG